VTTPPEDAPEGTPGGVTDGKAQPSDMDLPGQEAPAGEPPAKDTPGADTGAANAAAADTPAAAPPVADKPADEPPVEEAEAEDNANLPALRGEERLAEPVARTGMFGVTSTGDTSGYGLLKVHRPPLRTAGAP
jgi:hypothetical protein